MTGWKICPSNPSTKPGPNLEKARTVEFHLSRRARARYGADESLFSLSGNVIFPDFRAVRKFALRINEVRQASRSSEPAVRAGELNALGLIDEILHYVVGLYRDEKNPRIMKQVLAFVNGRVGAAVLNQTLERFVDEFPPMAVYRNQVGTKEYLAKDKNRETAIEEMLMLWLGNVNPAFSPYEDFFLDLSLKNDTAYGAVIECLKEFFLTQPPFGPDGQNLIDMLRSPAIAVPHSLPGQLRYIREKWGLLLGRYLDRLLISLDLIREEQKSALAGPPGPGSIPVHDFGGAPRDEREYERFSPDRDWMPRLVLMAKSVHVWLDQLSKKYGRSIATLDQIPDEELDILSSWGFTGLWLIGVWERSPASRRIKQLCGNPEALASAYSLADYRVAAELGGDSALENLRDRAGRRGIRLASDMVPNHMGIDSPWVMEYPEWFVSLEHSPFPSYRFGGPDLSSDPRAGLFLEDHYYDRTDAAVVFKRIDRKNGRVRYIYHGNDGTRMPWNDTAQLNYLVAEVREAVIRTILDVARKFPIIRFDAAMTLTKRHFQRLWFPVPGTGGDIPSRSEFGMTRENFDRRMPEEFWRQVVDRVASEAPDTLLLAEAFWMMEGYFVRTLGMHRVYNSAFMNFLKEEENDKFRLSLKNVLHFNPEILKRFVNFMNNPDEETAVRQFGKGDKYFGVCTLMATLPGLPMFGHGQIEGFGEKYGMEYRKAYWEEQADGELVARHDREIFPLLRRRHLFSGVENFLLYDFDSGDRKVNENVFAYSNRSGGERAVVIFNNKYESPAGWIRLSTATAERGGANGASRLVRKTIGEGLTLSQNGKGFVLFRDHRSGLEYIRRNSDLWRDGLYVMAAAYQTFVFLDFREVPDDPGGHYAALARHLDGRGVPSVEASLREMIYRPVHRAFRELLQPERIRRLAISPLARPAGGQELEWLIQLRNQLQTVFIEIRRMNDGRGESGAIEERVVQDMVLWERICLGSAKPTVVSPKGKNRSGVRSIGILLPAQQEREVFLSWLLVRRLGEAESQERSADASVRLLKEWGLQNTLKSVFMDLGVSAESAGRRLLLVRVLISHQDWARDWPDQRPVTSKSLTARLAATIDAVFREQEGREWLQVNEYRNLLWFHREAFGELVGGLLGTALFSDPRLPDSLDRMLGRMDRMKKTISAMAERSEYRVERFLEVLSRRIPQGRKDNR